MRVFFFNLSPLQVFVSTFALFIVLGAALLATPWAVSPDPETRERDALAGIDALFTATSAMCVTGLIVVDTGSAFSAFGQTVIIALIQIGGLGIMTFSTFILLAMGRKIGITGQYMIKDTFSESGSVKIGHLLKLIASGIKVVLE